MNPQFEQSQGLHLPEPSRQAAQFAPAPENQRSVELPHAPNVAPLQPLAPVAAPATPANPVPPAQPIPTPTLAIPFPADDIEDPEFDEKWINSAKEIVEKTRADPYMQSKELGKFKADYLQVRHNKNIKTADGQQK